MASSRSSGGASVAGGPRKRIGWLGKILIGLLVLAIVGVLAVVGIYQTMPIPDPNKEFQTENTELFYRDGKEPLGTLSVQNRTSIPYSEMPQTMKDAMVAAENMTFWDDRGIDPAGLARAVQSLVGPGETVGGSTITQQYVKVLYLNQDKTFIRKFREILLALRINEVQSKEQILEGYLNTVYFGRGAYGVQAAAQTFFGIDAKQLNIQQAVALASLVNAPNLLDPAMGDKQKADLLERYQVTLNHLVEMGKMTPAQRQQIYTKLPSFPTIEKDSRFGGTKGYLMTMVQQELRAKGFDDAEISGGGLRVITTFDKRLQASAVDAAQSAARRAARERGKNPNDLHPALASIDTKTGGVLAAYGGPDYVKSNKNWATTPRPTGSTFKPWALVAGLRNGFSMYDTFNGSYFLPRGAHRAVRNAGGSAYGAVTLLEATTKSINTAYMDLVSQIPDGPDKVIKAAEDAGLPRNNTWTPVPSIPLGFAEVDVIHAANGFATLANEGVRREAHVISEVRDRNGNVLYKADVKNDQAIEKDVAINAASALTRVTSSGTGRSVSGLGYQIAGKTGTRYDSEKDATMASWFVGSTKQISTAVMFVAGDEGNSNLDAFSSGFYGSGYPARTWLSFMRDAMDGLDHERFSGPVRRSAERSYPTRVAAPAPTQTSATPTRVARTTSAPATTTTSAPRPSSTASTTSAAPAPTKTTAKPTPAPTSSRPAPSPTATRPSQTRPTSSNNAQPPRTVRPTNDTTTRAPSDGGTRSAQRSTTP
ncbi:transglycosylase domain-containing protein [Nigerium massiliense]|uniref:transglycosylase domain-containing protein n=1 Tax=Nigerium massiliense TaxID=1522317 RepID=UPI0006937BCE|nr:transglycosylase domain-containing protein [Nigerium massiliense]